MLRRELKYPIYIYQYLLSAELCYRPVKSLNMTSHYYAIGDIHGRDDLLASLHERITEYHHTRHCDELATIVHLGDYVDRGADSLKVLDRLMAGVSGFDVICLKGNHEDMMLSCLETDASQAWPSWLANSGERTLMSLGVSPGEYGYSSGQLAQALGAERIAWLRSLPLYHRAGDYLFVHAGILPGRPIELQEEKDLLWIRHHFLESDDDHGYIVVHGHTPGDEPDVRPNRVGIDTGAPLTGKLTAAILGEADGLRFISVQGEPADNFCA